MKTSLPKFLKSRVAHAGGLLAFIAVIAVSAAWSDQPEGRAQLDGTWVGKLGDITWTSAYTPDSSGHNATMTLQWVTLSADFENLFGLLGADHSSIAFGSASMVRPDTARGKSLWYNYADGTPSATAPVAGQIKAVAVMANELVFTSPTTAVGKHNLKIYYPDPQNPMVPNETYLFFEKNYESVPHVRIF